LLKLPGNLTAETFLDRHWQKQPLMIKGALDRVRPSISRNELGWLATLSDVESRLIFVERDGDTTRYRTETGPFEPEYLEGLPKRDWTLLVHDLEKHLPEMRALFDHVNFIPDWRIDDLMVSFAAPGGGVGPHRDNYDVFLCQGTGVRNWKFTANDVPDDPLASTELSLLEEFGADQDHDAAQGDVLYLPPGVAHWGVAKRACMTYSIGMRAPQMSDFEPLLTSGLAMTDAFYQDPDLASSESQPGYISESAAARVCALIGIFATQTKDWLLPESATADEADRLLEALSQSGRLRVHGMAKIAFDDRNVYVNGQKHAISFDLKPLLAEICSARTLLGDRLQTDDQAKLAHWLLTAGALELPENL
jgi:50S ribosomal protein L16 3-hydroxylase